MFGFLRQTDLGVATAGVPRSGTWNDFALANPTVREDCAAHLAKRLAAKQR